jgi:hypothetical protein
MGHGSARVRLIVLCAALTGGCAWTSVHPVDYGDRAAPGLRVYDPKPLLLVTSSGVSVVFVPDFERAYRVEFGALLAKNNVSLKTSQGALTDLQSAMDTTGPLTLVQTLGQTALEQLPKLRALGADVEGTIAARTGLYEFEYDRQGRFVRFKRIDLPEP